MVDLPTLFVASLEHALSYFTNVVDYYCILACVDCYIFQRKLIAFWDHDMVLLLLIVVAFIGVYDCFA